MKRLVAAVLVTVVLLSFVGCAAKDDSNDQGLLLGRFVVIESHDFKADGVWQCNYNLVYDQSTLVEYIVIRGAYSSISVCPYYDENGNVVIYEGE